MSDEDIEDVGPATASVIARLIRERDEARERAEQYRKIGNNHAINTKRERARAEKAEAARDEALAEVERLRRRVWPNGA